ncbi:concanavalin A-like lectin/glucanase domain-containing protein [Panaeolus papilionaceus]|nr:concanavalin A-like lectin/glucanase domain-containing protein [Panaeolus papilionaceus]
MHMVEYNVIQGQGKYVTAGATCKESSTCNRQESDILLGHSTAQSTIPILLQENDAGVWLMILNFQSLLSLALAFLCLCATATAQAVTPSFPLSLARDGEYVYTDHVPGCTKGAGPSVNATWTGLQGFEMCAVGWSVGQANRTINYQADYSPNGNGVFAVYGWTRNPTIEYSIVQGSGNYVASDASLKGSVTCNGQVYDILLGKQYAASVPGIDGTVPFPQYWSRRRAKQFVGARGPVDVGCHVRAFESFGMRLGSEWDFQLVVMSAYYASLKGGVKLV